MKIVATHQIISVGDFAQSAEWQFIRNSAQAAVISAEWPENSGKFSIYPESGKKSGMGNGVKPIKNNVIRTLTENKLTYSQLYKQKKKSRVNAPIVDEWVAEHPWPMAGRIKPGNMDAAYVTNDQLVCFEWETGNISSSHRSINKICLGLLKGVIKGGILVVPSRALYPYLTDRIGNVAELEPYFDLWRATPCEAGIFEIFVIEHDETSFDVPRIPKGTDGRAKI
tara:strand:+ start:11531 stop:12205 length:675 start_codon:yes stop_codon:yes gene_type:complete